MTLALTQSKGNKKIYLKAAGWRLLPEILLNTNNILHELAALGEGVGIQKSRNENSLKLAKNWEGF